MNSYQVILSSPAQQYTIRYTILQAIIYPMRKVLLKRVEAYLNTAFEDEDKNVFLLTLRDVAGTQNKKAA